MRVRNKIVSGICGSALLAGAAYEHDVIYDLYLHQPTAQEALISAGLLRAYNNLVTVRCLESEGDEDAVGERLAPFSQSLPGQVHDGGALPRPLPKLIWLSQDICDGLEQYAERDDKSVVSRFEVTSLRAGTHEMEHIEWTYAENRAECNTAQHGDLLPLAWGASEANARHTGQRIADLTLVGKEKLPPEYTLDPQKCRDGGAWDLDPAHPGIFPEYKKSAR